MRVSVFNPQITRRWSRTSDREICRLRTGKGGQRPLPVPCHPHRCTTAAMRDTDPTDWQRAGCPDSRSAETMPLARMRPPMRGGRVGALVWREHSLSDLLSDRTVRLSERVQTADNALRDLLGIPLVTSGRCSPKLFSLGATDFQGPIGGSYFPDRRRRHFGHTMYLHSEETLDDESPLITTSTFS